jgi:hypothetical protein
MHCSPGCRQLKLSNHAWVAPDSTSVLGVTGPIDAQSPAIAALITLPSLARSSMFS